jgi:hypothetical protein
MRDGWLKDMFIGFFYATLILLSLLFFSAGAAHFIYVDF